jgi:hypothetical protein
VNFLSGWYAFNGGFGLSWQGHSENSEEVIVMRIFCRRIGFGSFVALLLALLGGRALMAAVPYAITATNVTMPNGGGMAITHYTVSGIPLDGTLAVNCAYSGPTTTAHLPTCVYGPLTAPAPVMVGQTVTGSINFYPYGSAVPVTAQRTKPVWPAGGILAAGLLIGFGFRRKMPHWLAAVVLAVAGVAEAAAVTGCAGGGNGMTPGTYAYTLTASNEATPNTPLGVAATTTIHVTIP